MLFLNLLILLIISPITSVSNTTKSILFVSDYSLLSLNRSDNEGKCIHPCLFTQSLLQLIFETKQCYLSEYCCRYLVNLPIKLTYTDENSLSALIRFEIDQIISVLFSIIIRMMKHGISISRRQ